MPQYNTHIQNKIANRVQILMRHHIGYICSILTNILNENCIQNDQFNNFRRPSTINQEDLIFLIGQIKSLFNYLYYNTFEELIRNGYYQRPIIIMNLMQTFQFQLQLFEQSYTSLENVCIQVKQKITKEKKQYIKLINGKQSDKMNHEFIKMNDQEPATIGSSGWQPKASQYSLFIDCLQNFLSHPFLKLLQNDKIISEIKLFRNISKFYKARLQQIEINPKKMYQIIVQIQIQIKNVQSTYPNQKLIDNRVQNVLKHQMFQLKYNALIKMQKNNSAIKIITSYLREHQKNWNFQHKMLQYTQLFIKYYRDLYLIYKKLGLIKKLKQIGHLLLESHERLLVKYQNTNKSYQILIGQSEEGISKKISNKIQEVSIQNKQENQQASRQNNQIDEESFKALIKLRYLIEQVLRLKISQDLWKNFKDLKRNEKIQFKIYSMDLIYSNRQQIIKFIKQSISMKQFYVQIIFLLKISSEIVLNRCNQIRLKIRKQSLTDCKQKTKKQKSNQLKLQNTKNQFVITQCHVLLRFMFDLHNCLINILKQLFVIEHFSCKQNDKDYQFLLKHHHNIFNQKQQKQQKQQQKQKQLNQQKQQKLRQIIYQQQIQQLFNKKQLQCIIKSIIIKFILEQNQLIENYLFYNKKQLWRDYPIYYWINVYKIIEINQCSDVIASELFNNNNNQDVQVNLVTKQKYLQFFDIEQNLQNSANSSFIKFTKFVQHRFKISIFDDLIILKKFIVNSSLHINFSLKLCFQQIQCLLLQLNLYLQRIQVSAYPQSFIQFSQILSVNQQKNNQPDKEDTQQQKKQKYFYFLQKICSFSKKVNASSVDLINRYILCKISNIFLLFESFIQYLVKEQMTELFFINDSIAEMGRFMLQKYIIYQQTNKIFQLLSSLSHCAQYFSQSNLIKNKYWNYFIIVSIINWITKTSYRIKKQNESQEKEALKDNTIIQQSKQLKIRLLLKLGILKNYEIFTFFNKKLIQQQIKIPSYLIIFILSLAIPIIGKFQKSLLQKQQKNNVYKAYSVNQKQRLILIKILHEMQISLRQCMFLCMQKVSALIKQVVEYQIDYYKTIGRLYHCIHKLCLSIKEEYLESNLLNKKNIKRKIKSIQLIQLRYIEFSQTYWQKYQRKMIKTESENNNFTSKAVLKIKNKFFKMHWNLNF